MTTVKIGAVQPPLRNDDEDPVEHTKSRVLPLLKPGLDLYVLPELCPIGYSENTFSTYLHRQDVQDEIDQLISRAARDLGAFIAYGRIGGSRTTTIQQCVVNDQGTVVAQYDKQLLCNYGDCAETRFFQAGTELVSFVCKGFTFGLLICADMRNSAWARTLTVEHNVDAILQPAAFSRDLSFRTWKSFRETRAVENSIYWVGVNYAGSYFGSSCVVPPWVDEDHEPLALGMKEGVLVETLDRNVLDHVRSNMPYYQMLRQGQGST